MQLHGLRGWRPLNGRPDGPWLVGKTSACGRRLSLRPIGPIAQIPLGSSRLDSTRLDTFDVSSESRRACRACPAVLFQHGGRRTSYSARLYKFSRFCALTYTNPIVLSNKINVINVHSNKLVNNLHKITLYKLHNKLSCQSRLSCRTCRASRFRRVERVELVVSSVSRRAVRQARHITWPAPLQLQYAVEALYNCYMPLPLP